MSLKRLRYFLKMSPGVSNWTLANLNRTLGLLALRLVSDSLGKFQVHGVTEAGIPSLPLRNPSASDSFVALVSGMHYGSEDGAASTARSLLVEFLNGDIFVSAHWI